MEKTQVVILAAGQGTRMKSEIPKVLVSIYGKPLVEWLVESVRKSGLSKKPLVVVNKNKQQFKKVLGNNCFYITQKEQLGTGHALSCTEKLLKGKAKNILVLYGDHPFVSSQTIKQLALLHQKQGKVLTMNTTLTPDFRGWRKALFDFGRIIRDKQGNILGIVEKKDATSKQLRIKEVNPSYFCFESDWLWRNLPKLTNDNTQSEYYLTDLVKIAITQGQKIASESIAPFEALGINTVEQLNLAEKLVQSKQIFN